MYLSLCSTYCVSNGEVGVIVNVVYIYCKCSTKTCEQIDIEHKMTSEKYKKINMHARRLAGIQPTLECDGMPHVWSPSVKLMITNAITVPVHALKAHSLKVMEQGNK